MLLELFKFSVITTLILFSLQNFSIDTDDSVNDKM